MRREEAVWRTEADTAQVEHPDVKQFRGRCRAEHPFLPGPLTNKSSWNSFRKLTCFRTPRLESRVENGEKEERRQTLISSPVIVEQRPDRCQDA